jgi:hypothetical protein
MDSTAVPLFRILGGRELGLSASGEARIAGSPCPLLLAPFCAVAVLFCLAPELFLREFICIQIFLFFEKMAVGNIGRVEGVF